MSFARSEWDIGKGSAVTIHLLASSTQLAEGLYCSSYHPPFTKKKAKDEEENGNGDKSEKKKKKEKGKMERKETKRRERGKEKERVAC